MNRRRDRWLKRGLEASLQPFFHRPSMTLDQIAAEDPRRILIVRQHNQMGDMLCAVPAFRAIRERFPDATTCIVTAPVNHQVVRGNPYLDQVMLFDKAQLRGSPAAAWRFWRDLRGFGAELAFVLNSVSYSGTSSWLAVLSGAKRIVGGDSRPFGWSFSEWLYNLVLPSSPVIEGHAIDHSLRPLASVGIVTDDRSTVLRPSPEDFAVADTFLEPLKGRPIAALHPGAGKLENQWPADRFAAIARRLLDEGWSVYGIEGPTDGPASQALLESLGQQLPVLRDVGIATVGAALAASDLALVNDTGVMHVAGAVGTPTIALFGPTASDTWKPPSEQVRVLQSPTGSMEGLGVDQVWSALQGAANSAKGRGGVGPSAAVTDS